MAKIDIPGVLLFILLFASPLLSSQAQTGNNSKKKRVEIEHSDLMTSEGDFKRLIGNVYLIHNEMHMTCDSAHYFEQADLVRAYSKVHISKGDTLHIYGEYLIYDSSSEKAEVIDSVILIDNQTTLYTDHIYYDMTQEVARYMTGGKILNEDNVLTSIVGIYFSEPGIFHFKDSVELVNPDYTMYSDTLEYDTKTEIAYFLGPSEVIGDSIYVRCDKGWYDTKNEKSLLLFDAKVDNKQQIITGDSIYYENGTGYGTAFFDVSITDLSKDIIVKGNKAWYYKDPERFMVTDSAQFIQVQDNDFLFLHADTLWSVTKSYTTQITTPVKYNYLNDSIVPGYSDDDSLSVNTTVKDTIVNYRLLRAYNGCRIFSSDLQASCDSLSYTFQDSIIRMYYEPIIWSDMNQLTADSMFLYTRNNEMSLLKLFNNAFVVEEVDSTRYQQIKGKNLTGYFRDGSIYKIEVTGNGENIYFALEENELVGVNQATCASMDIYLEDGKIQEIYFLKNPDGSLDPPLHKQPTERRLANFIWLDYLRPVDRWDIFRSGKSAQKSEDSSKNERNDGLGNKLPDAENGKKKSRTSGI